ncbi:hypothetical protein FRC05_001397 [Tulasnella sp. 425]|nr:hypothetical protein FRC05_001397 [Tulasnella sp. 425]
MTFTRRQDSLIFAPALAYPPSATNVKTHAIIISIAKGDPAEPLDGVKGDLPLVLDEFTARVKTSIQVITDLPVTNPSPKTQILLPTAQHVEDSIKRVGEAMKPGDLCCVYLAGHANQDSPETAYMPLPSGGCLHGKNLTAWMKAACSNGGDFLVIADVCFAASLIRLPFVCDVNDGQLSWKKIKSGEKEAQGKNGQVVALLSTDYNQKAGTIIQNKEPYLGWHGLFTWALFNFVRNEPLEVDLTNLLLHLRKHGGWHPAKPRPQVSATTEGRRQVPVGRLSS